MTNSVFLMASYMIVVLKKTAEEAYDTFKPYHSILKTYRDASKGECYY